MDDIDTQIANNGGFPPKIQIVSLNVPPAVWPDLARLLEKVVPNAELVRMRPEAEADGEAAFMLKPRTPF